MRLLAGDGLAGAPACGASTGGVWPVFEDGVAGLGLPRACVAVGGVEPAVPDKPRWLDLRRDGGVGLHGCRGSR